MDSSACVPLASQGSTVKPTWTNACRRPVFMAGTELRGTCGSWKSFLIIIMCTETHFDIVGLREWRWPQWFDSCSCEDGIFSYSCLCQAGWTGSRCETNIDVSWAQLIKRLIQPTCWFCPLVWLWVSLTQLISPQDKSMGPSGSCKHCTKNLIKRNC